MPTYAPSVAITNTTPLSAPGALTATATADAGNPNGTYTYKVTLVTAFGETTGGTASASASPASKTVSLTNIPLGGTGTTARKVYRNQDGDTVYYLLTTIANNSATTYTDNTADASLGTTTLPPENTAFVGLVAGLIYWDTVGTTMIDYYGRVGNRKEGQTTWFNGPTNTVGIGYTDGLYLYSGDIINYTGATSAIGISAGVSSMYYQNEGGSFQAAISAGPHQTYDAVVSVLAVSGSHIAGFSLRANTDQVTTQGEIVAHASTTAFPSLNIPDGTAPTSPATGDLYAVSGILTTPNGGAFQGMPTTTDPDVKGELFTCTGAELAGLLAGGAKYVLVSKHA